MSDRSNLEALSLQRFAVGQPVRRAEDQKLVRGQGAYTDDVNLERQAYGVVVKSTVAHGIIAGVDTVEALAMPGVLAIYTGADIAKAGYGGLTSRLPLKSRDGSAMKMPERPVLTGDKVRFVGDPIAFVVAEKHKRVAELVRHRLQPLHETNTAFLAEAIDLQPDILDRHAKKERLRAEFFAGAQQQSKVRPFVGFLEPELDR